MADIMLAAKEVAKRENVNETGFRLLINAGADAGQEVDHLHVHLFGGRRLGPMICS
jgi:histidine triad (HIT) family protein